MPIRSTLELGDPALRQRAAAVAEPIDERTRAVVADLHETLRAFKTTNGWGRALAAPVIGVNQRIVVLHWQQQEIVLINPRFESWSRTQTGEYERCVTFGSLMGLVYRPAACVVVALGEDGFEQRFEADGQFARVLQHEIDHLDGLVWLDRDPDLSSICTAAEHERQEQSTAGPDHEREGL